MIAKAENTCLDEQTAVSVARPSMTTKELTIDPELKSLLPELTQEERWHLEMDLLDRGCLSAIATWNKVIIDGHNRYELCTKNNIPFEITELTFSSKDEAKYWMLKNQLARRNLTPIQRAEIVLKYKPIIAEQAKQNLRHRAKPSQELEKVDSMDTMKILGGMAGMSHESLRRAERIIEQQDESVMERLRNGSTTINKEYAAIRKKEGKEQRTKNWQDQFTTITFDASYTDPKTPIGAFADVTPIHLLCHLGDFSDSYLHETIMSLLERLLKQPNRKRGAMRIINDILKKYGLQSQVKTQD